MVSSKDHPFHKFGTGKKIFGHPHLITLHTLEAVCLALNMCKGSLRLHFMQEIWRPLILDPNQGEWIHVMSWSNFIRPTILLTSCGLWFMVEVSPGSLSLVFTVLGPQSLLVAMLSGNLLCSPYKITCRDGDSANMIYLPLDVVVSAETESIDELTDLVHNKFSSINNTGRKAEKFSGQPCLPEHLQVK